MDWLVKNRETSIRQKELVRTLKKRSHAIKKMDEDMTSKQIASKLINSTFNMKLPDTVGKVPLCHINPSMAKAGAKIIYDKINIGR